MLWRLREVKNLQKKSLKLAEFDSQDLRTEDIFIKMQGEAASGYGEASASYPKGLTEIIHFIKQQIFQCRQNNLLLEEDTTRNFISRKERSMTGFKASKDRLTLLLEANAADEASLPQSSLASKF